MRSLEIGSTGMAAQQMNVDVISNNIANMTTTGYKRERVDFKDLMYQDIQRPGAQSGTDTQTLLPTGLQIGLGVKMNSTYRINEQGTLQTTGNPLDLAVNGNGYLQVKMPDGTTSYTRSGVLQLNAQGQLVTSQGFQIIPQISIPTNASSVQISTTGVVSAQIPGQTQLQSIGQLQLATFINPAGLDAIGNSLFTQTDASGQPTVDNPGNQNLGTLVQGQLETSNVDIVNEITSLITAQRAYEMNSNVIQSSDQMMQTLTQLK